MTSHLAAIEQSIAETEMRITMERALTQQIPDANVESATMAALQDALRRKMARRWEIIARSERFRADKVALAKSYQLLREARALLGR